jgi:hypothetical protein
MSFIKLGETKIYDFTVHDPVTGSASNADSAPTVMIYEGSNSTEMISTTATQRGVLTGNYYISIAYSTTLGYGLGHSYNVIASATVGGVIGKGVIDSVYLEERLRIVGLVDTAVGATSTTFGTDLEGYSTAVDAFMNCLLLFTGGINVGQVQKIAAYDGTGVVILEHGFASAPSTDDTFIVVNI